ncbi:MAG: hypothetical protein QM607_09450 [Microbacterium sp.]
MTGPIVMMALAGVLIGLMLWGWRRHARRDADVAVPFAPSEGTPTASFTGLHVATTHRDEPLKRLHAKPLDFRARGTFTVTASGLGLDLTGADSLFIRRQALTGAGRATWTIDRVVERDGLVMVGWRADAGEYDTYLRVDDPDDLVDAIEDLIHTTPTEATR